MLLIGLRMPFVLLKIGLSLCILKNLLLRLLIQICFLHKLSLMFIIFIVDESH